jgi:hypothetical protein
MMAGLGMTGLSVVASAQAPTQTEQDAYTRIELQSPDTGAFKVTHEVAATSAGSRVYEMALWPGTQVSAPKAVDLMTGADLGVALRILKAWTRPQAVAPVRFRYRWPGRFPKTGKGAFASKWTLATTPCSGVTGIGPCSC